MAKNQLVQGGKNSYLIYLLALMMVTGTLAEVVLSNAGGDNPGNPYSYTISESTTAGMVSTVTVNLTSSSASLPYFYYHNVACFPNDNYNEMDDGDSLTGWLFYIVCTLSSGCSDASRIEGRMRDVRLSKNGDNYDFFYVNTDLSKTISWDSVSYAGNELVGVFEEPDSVASPVGMYPNITSAICIFAKDTDINTGSVHWGIRDKPSVNLNSEATMIFYGPERPTVTDTSDDIGGKSSFASVITLTAVLATQTILAFY